MARRTSNTPSNGSLTIEDKFWMGKRITAREYRMWKRWGGWRMNRRGQR